MTQHDYVAVTLKVDPSISTVGPNCTRRNATTAVCNVTGLPVGTTHQTLTLSFDGDKPAVAPTKQPLDITRCELCQAAGFGYRALLLTVSTATSKHDDHREQQCRQIAPHWP